VTLLSAVGGRTGRQGRADRLARKRHTRMEALDIDTVFQSGLHEWLQDYVRENAALDEGIAHQFRFA
jgi:uncharacterized alpha-E superfamily protein